MIDDENKRVSTMSTLLINSLKTDSPAIGALAMAYLLAAHTKMDKEVWLKELGRLYDYYHPEKNESN